MASRTELLNDPEAALRLALDGRQSMIWTALPATVQKVNLAKMTVEVQPTIQGEILLEDGTTQNVNLPVLVDVPICFPSAGGFTLTFPISSGDEVLVIFSSRCIDSWWQSGGVLPPAEFRMHDLSDGFAIPGPKSLPNVLPNISSSNAQLRNLAGTTYLEITPSGTIRIQGNLEVSGNITTTSGDVTAGTVSLKTHVHSGVQPGSGTSGPPV